jgi:hypothetical protein
MVFARGRDSAQSRDKTNSDVKIFFATRDIPSIFAAHRIRRVMLSCVARPEAGFFVARSNDLGAALF